MSLRRALGEAVAQEEYERAAQLRDEIGTIEGGNGLTEHDESSQGRQG